MMVNSTIVNLNVCLLVILLSLVFCCWCSWKIWQCRPSNRIKIRLNNNSRKGQIIQPLFPCIFARCFTATEFSHALCLANTLFIIATWMAGLGIFVISFIRSYNGESWSEYTKPSKMNDLVIMWMISIICLSLAIGCKFTALFEQVRTTFSSTKYRLPLYAPKLFYSLVILGLIFQIILILTFSAISFLICLVIGSVFCVCLTALILRVFFVRIMDITRTMNNINDENNNQNVELLESATRVGICCVLTVILAGMDMIASGVSVYLCDWCWTGMFIRLFFLSLDLNSNCFFIMSSFFDHKSYYHAVLDPLHNLILSQITQMT